MEDATPMPYHRQILLSSNPVPRRWAVFSSGCAHLVALALIFALRNAAGPHVVPEKNQAVEMLSGTDRISFNPAEAKAGQPNASPFHLPRTTRRTHARATQAGEGGPALQV